MTPDALRAPRWLPDEPFPPYAFVPGRWPHPTRHLEGHSHGAPEREQAAPDPARWRESRGYLRGIDLFNAGYYWEAHESWEGVWHPTGHRGPVADLLVGLIRLAAAGIKLREPVPRAVRSHARKGAEVLQRSRETSGGDRLLGLSLPGLIGFARGIEAGELGHSSHLEAEVEVVFPFVLWPGGPRARP